MDASEFQTFVRATLTFAGYGAWLPSRDTRPGDWAVVHHRESGHKIVLGDRRVPELQGHLGEPVAWDDENRMVAAILADLMEPESWRAQMWASVGCLPTEELLLAFAERQRFSLAVHEAAGTVEVSSAVTTANGSVHLGHSFTANDRLEAIATVIKWTVHRQPLVPEPTSRS